MPAPHRVTREVQLLGLPCRNRPAKFARCPRCPPGACQRRLPIISPDMLDFMEELLGMCRGRCPHRPADLPEGSDFLGLPCRNRPAKFARCTRCPPRACQRRLLSLPVSVMLIFKSFSYVSGQPYFVRRLQVCISRLPFRAPEGRALC